MGSDSKTYSAEAPAVPPSQSIVVATGYRRYFVWAQIVIVFLFLELAIWAPRRALRNRWATIAAVAIFVFVLLDAVLVDARMDRSSLKRLGLGLPRPLGAIVVLGIGLAAAFFVLILASLAGAQIPANPKWFPNLQSAWGYVLWALLQEFILQSFFFNRCEELYGGTAAVWMASTLFAAAHLPNPVLTPATLIGALFFCEMFRRYRSIYPIAIVHAILGVTVALVTPDSLLHHMRVGIGYLRY
jgi:membrane protease YdiL (CAAX protease family)